MLTRICQPRMAKGLHVMYPPAMSVSVRPSAVLSVCLKSSKSNGGSEPPPTFAMEPFKDQMVKTLDACKKALSDLKVSRSDPTFLHKLPVAHQQTTVPLSKIAEIQLLTPPIAWMILTPDEKWVPLIEKAIRKFDPSLNSVREDDCSLRVPVPKNSAGYKDSLLKSAKDISDRMKGQIRIVRGDARTALKKSSGALSKDQVRKLEQSIQTITDDFVKQIEATTVQKTKEVQKI